MYERKNSTIVGRVCVCITGTLIKKLLFGEAGLCLESKKQFWGFCFLYKCQFKLVTAVCWVVEMQYKFNTCISFILEKP